MFLDLTVTGAYNTMTSYNHLKWNPMQCIIYSFLQSTIRFFYEIFIFLALIVVLVSLLTIFSNHAMFQSSTQTVGGLSVMPNFKLGVKSNAIISGNGNGNNTNPTTMTGSDVSTSDNGNSNNANPTTMTGPDVSTSDNGNSKNTNPTTMAGPDFRTISVTTVLTPTAIAEPELNITNLKLKSIDVKKLIVQLKNSKSYSKGFTKDLSSPQIDEIANIFGLASHNFSDNLRRQFLDCSGITLLRQSVKNGGILHIPKHFQTCKNMTFQKTGNFVGLLSWPGSGNSWVRQILETATGIYTGAWYCDSNYINTGMLGEGVKDNNVLVMKIHFPGPKWVPEKVMYIVRNPFDCIVAEWNRLLQEYHHPEMQHTAAASQKSFGE